MSSAPPRLSVAELIDVEADWSAPAYVYRCYQPDGLLLYVGATTGPVQRMRGHYYASWWFLEVGRIEFTAMPDRESALAAERAAIKAERPRWNRSGRPPRKEWTPQMVRDDVLNWRLTSWWGSRFEAAERYRAEIEAGVTA